MDKSSRQPTDHHQINNETEGKKKKKEKVSYDVNCFTKLSNGNSQYY